MAASVTDCPTISNKVGSTAPLIQGADGNFYGTTPEGGSGAGGTVFKITPAGAFSTLYSFTGPDGSGPTATFTARHFTADPATMAPFSGSHQQVF